MIISAVQQSDSVTCTNTYIHIHIYVHVYIYIHTYIYACVYTYIYILFFILLSIMVYPRKLVVVPCTAQEDLVIYPFY